MLRFAIAGLILAVGLGVAQQGKEPPKLSPATGVLSANTAPDLLSEAHRLYNQGQFDSAVQKYQQALARKPDLAEAYAGLARVYMKQKNVRLADETISKGVEVADSPRVRVVLGEVYFRQGKISEAEHEWVNMINSGHGDGRAYLGLARVADALSLYKKAKDRVDKAHQLDPDDPDIQKYWIETLNRSERIKNLEEYLATVKSDDAKTREGLQYYLEYLKARQQGPARTCKLIGNVSSTQVNLVPLLFDPTHMRGLGLAVSVNGVKSNLLFDTGADGILIDRGIAEKSGLKRLSDSSISGIGDKGPSAGWVGLAHSIKIGELEFQDCPVEVMDKRSVDDENGLIGADVFDDFLVDINLPAQASVE